MNIIQNIVEEPVKRKHICYYTTIVDGYIILLEIEEVFYIHPDSDGGALISKIEDKMICKHRMTDVRSIPLQLIDLSQENMRMILTI
jgi:hypothetical protein